MNIVTTALDITKKLWGFLADNATSIANLATATSVIVAVVTYWKSVRRARVEKATQISEIFAKDLSQKVGLIIYLLNPLFDNKKLKTPHTNVKDYMFEKVNNKAELFDENEYKNIFNDDERNIIDHWFSFDNLTEEYIAKYEIRTSSSLEERTKRFDFFLEVYKKKDAGFKAIERSCVATELNGIIVDMLNTLEYVSMNFVKNIAHRDTAYQSLHQLFFCIVAILYPRIASQNIDGKDKYCTNIIALYKIWGKKYKKQIAKEKKLHLRIEKKRRKLEAKMNKIPEKTTCKSGSM